MRIAATDLQIVFGTKKIIDVPDLALVPGEVTIIVGPNGAGKSTLLRALAGDLTPWQGLVSYGDMPLYRLKLRDLAGHRAVLSQSIDVTFPFTVFEVVRLGMLAGTHGLDQLRARNLPHEALTRVDLAGFEHRDYASLSGGEQQRVQLARVLCQAWQPILRGSPRYLFLDEPSASLDIRHQLLVLDIAAGYARAGGGVLAILHDLNLAASYADRIIVMSRGAIVADGRPSDTITSAMINQVFAVDIGVGAIPSAGTPFILPQTSLNRQSDS